VLWKNKGRARVKVVGFSGTRLAKVAVKSGIAGLWVEVAHWFRGTVRIRGFSCATHRRISLAPPNPNGDPGGSYKTKSVTAEGSAIPFTTDLQTKIPVLATTN
jgi:hypothetical protein